jgi:IclR family pca regulon transcriptional regulator
MGRVLLGALPDAELEERLDRIDVQPLTARTVASRDALRRVIEQVRRQGYALTDQELEQGLRSVAVPIHDASGAVVAALNISVHASRASVAELRSRFLPPAREAAAAIDAELRKSGLRATAGSTPSLSRG